MTHLIIPTPNRPRADRRTGSRTGPPDTYDGDDLAEYVIDANSSRRHMSTGARAMATALVLADDGRRENGRWKRGSVAIPESGNSGKTWSNAVNQAGTILDYRPDLAADVIAGETALDAAYRQAVAARDEIPRRDRARRG